MINPDFPLRAVGLSLLAHEVKDPCAHIFHRGTIGGTNAWLWIWYVAVTRRRGADGVVSVISVVNGISGYRFLTEVNAQGCVDVVQGRKLRPVSGIEGVGFLLAEEEAAHVCVRVAWLGGGGGERGQI